MRIKRADLQTLIENYVFEQVEEDVDDAEESDADVDPEATDDEVEEEEPVEEPEEEDPAEDPEEEEEAPEEPPEKPINLDLQDIKLSDTLAGNIKIKDGQVNVTIKKGDKLIDLNKIAQRSPGRKKEIEKDFIGIMMTALDRLKAKGSEYAQDVESVALKMLGVEDNPEYLTKNRQLAQYKTNVVDKYK
jgi:hypothetical protein